MQPLQFLPLSTSISPSFWHALTSRKLHEWKLSSEPVPLVAHYARGKTVRDRLTREEVGISGALELDQASFERVGGEMGQETGEGNSTSNTDRVRLRGILRNYNTIGEFRDSDKAKLLSELGDQVGLAPHAQGVPC
ncbi:hypothetical protein JCM10207_004927 [Rhodosporidiobolus poonsookiae]